MPSNFIHKEGYDPKVANPNDYFPTPDLLCQNAVKALFPNRTIRQGLRVLDAGSGSGNWGRAVREAWPDVDLVGVDLPESNYDNPYHKGVKAYNTWIKKDYRDLTLEDCDGRLFDMVIGNPPYSTSQGKRDMHLAEKFVAKSFELLKPDGQLFFFLRTDFLAGQFRQKHFWPKYPPHIVNICAERVNFFPDRGTGQTHNHCIIEWRKSSVGEQGFDYQLNFWSWK